MIRPRLIPALLLDKGRLVKTKEFRNPRYVGDPLNVIRIFNDKEADELLLLDIAASSAGVPPDFALLEEVSGEAFMPVTYGGGIRSIEDADKIFAAGVEKICVQSAALTNPSLVTELAARFGSQAIVASIDVTQRLGRYRLRIPAHVKSSQRDWKHFLHQVVDAGAGEILLTAVHREGQLTGMDLPLIAGASAGLTVPLVAHGGVGSLGDVRAGLEAGADAIAAGTFLTFQGPHRAVLVTYPTNLEL